MSPETAQHEPRLAWTRAESVFLAALLGVTFLCYASALGYEFVYDDRLLILKNPAILSWRSIPGFFLKDFTSVAIPEAPAVYYRPVLLVWMLVNAKIWGVHPPGWHFTAIALHLVVVAEVYVLARRLLANRFAAGVAAAVMALHPIHVECVAWVMAEAEQLTASLVLGSLLAYLRVRRNPSRRVAWWSLSLGLFSMAVLIKENAIMLPGLIAAYEWFYGAARLDGPPQAASRPARLGMRARASLLGAAPHLAAAAVYLAVRLAVIKSLGHVNTPLPVSTFLATLPLVLFRYLRLLLWPAGLSVCYDLPYVHHVDFQYFILPLVTVLWVAVLLVAWSFKNGDRAFAAVWLGLPLLPALDLPVFFRSEIVHDRYLYLPSVGFALLVGMAFGCRVRAESSGKRPLGRFAAAAALTGLMVAGTCYYRRFWKSNWTLFQRAVRIAPQNVVALNNLGNEYADRGRYDEAVALYRRVLDEYPPYWESDYNAGYCMYKRGRLLEALQFFQRAYEIEPYDSDVCIYYGITYFKMGRTDRAEPLVQRAIALRPEGRGFHLALGMILLNRGEPERARLEFRAELANYPGEAAAARELQEVERRLESAPAGALKP